uniref:CBS domain-containing protein n=1 Tax=Lotharella oceanica TaxID=641309 RepID=A0A7S2X876_9EUKA|mmetsp:Transcript_17056/g.32361  ORF Transcript_17056/g.32361 Transcript_17056/m.32361 type:complete len:348 (+) Transcript_17056:90-1133(+)
MPTTTGSEKPKVTFFDGLKVKNLVSFMVKEYDHSGELFTIQKTATVEAALKELKNRNVLSLPVCDDEGNIEGVISTLDIVVAVVFAPIYTRYDEQATSKLTLNDLKSVTTNKALFKSQVGNLCGINEESRKVEVFWDDDDLSEVANKLSRGFHRVLVKVREEPKKMYLVSQTDFLRYIHSQIQSQPGFAKCMSQPLGRLNLIEKKRIITVDETERVVLGFRKLWQGGPVFDWSLSALPVVDSKGELKGTLSGSDIRGMTADKLNDLMLSVRHFLRKHQPGGMRVPEQVTLEMPFSKALKQIIDAGVHRLWVTGKDKDKNKVTGVLSLTDILYKFATFDLNQHHAKSV